MPEINNIFIDDPKRLSEPIKTIEVSRFDLSDLDPCENCNKSGFSKMKIDRM